ncbi:MAG: hypothetical protein Q9162_004138 [Coniocarpon cinnabarinum]
MRILRERVGHQRQHFLIFVQQQHGSQISQALVGETLRGQQLEALNLTEVRAFTEGEEIEELGDIVASDVRVVRLFSEAGPNCGALFLDDRSFIGDSLCGADIADKLLDFITIDRSA